MFEKRRVVEDFDKFNKGDIIEIIHRYYGDTEELYTIRRRVYMIRFKDLLKSIFVMLIVSSILFLIMLPVSFGLSGINYLWILLVVVVLILVIAYIGD